MISSKGTHHLMKQKILDVTRHVFLLPIPSYKTHCPMDGSILGLQPTPCYSLSWPPKLPAWSGLVYFSRLLFHDSDFLECIGHRASFLSLRHPQSSPAQGFGTWSLPGMLFPSSSPVSKEINRASDHIWTSRLLISYHFSSNEM